MAAYTIIVDNGALTLNENVSWSLNANKIANEAGAIESTDIFLTLRGNVKKDTAELVMDGVIEKTDEVITKFLPVRIQIQRDGVDEYDFTPGTSLEGTPRIETFVDREPNEAGKGESHFKYELGVFVKVVGNVYQGAKEVHTAIEIEKNRRGEIIRKLWRARVKHKGYQQARSVALSFEPSGDNIARTERLEPQDATAEFIWIWKAIDKEQGSGVLETLETIKITGDGDDYIPDTQVDANGKAIKPVLHLAVGREVVIDIRGVTIALNEDPKPIKAHFTESENMKRAGGREEKGQFPQVLSLEEGTYSLQFHEVWIWTGEGSPPKPKHHAHNAIRVITPPSNGAIGGSA